jgi:hypothetical protein
MKGGKVFATTYAAVVLLGTVHCNGDKRTAAKPAERRWRHTLGTWPNDDWRAVCGRNQSQNSRSRGLVLSWFRSMASEHISCDVTLQSEEPNAEPTHVTISMDKHGGLDPDFDAAFEIVALVEECSIARDYGEPDCERQRRGFGISVLRTPTELLIIVEDRVNAAQDVSDRKSK